MIGEAKCIQKNHIFVRYALSKQMLQRFFVVTLVNSYLTYVVDTYSYVKTNLSVSYYYNINVNFYTRNFDMKFFKFQCKTRIQNIFRTTGIFDLDI